MYTTRLSISTVNFISSCASVSWCNYLFIILELFGSMILARLSSSLICVWLFCDPMDSCLPGASVHGVSQARTLEWVAISFPKGSSPPRDRIQVSCIFCLANGFFTTEPPGKCVCVECLQLEYPGPIFTRQYWFLNCRFTSNSKKVVSKLLYSLHPFPHRGYISHNYISHDYIIKISNLSTCRG